VGTTAGGRPPAIVARDLGFRHAGAAEMALEGVDLELESGACLLVLGPSGSGKSTFALAVAGLLGGDVPGHVSGSLRRDDAEVGVVFQDPDRQIVMERVADDVAFGLESWAWPLEAMHERIPEALADAGLAGFEGRASATLSGGQRQRLALAGALAPRPGLLVLDEPTANLDPAGARTFVERLAAVRAARAATIILVEHRAELVWGLADRLLVLGRDHRPIAVGPRDEVVARLGHLLVAEGVWLPVAVERDLGLVDDRPAVPSPSVGAPTVVAASDLGFAYERGRPVLEGVDLHIAAGERLAVVGQNGSGKSTLARLLVGLLRPTVGSVALLGDAPHRLPPAALAARAGLVFQDPERQFLATRVADEIALGLPSDARARAAATLEALGLPLASFGARSPYGLSGGEQRRLSLACVLVREPRLLILDEPTFGQDRLAVDGLLALLGDRAAAGTAIVAATHDERFVAAFASRVVELRAGRLVAEPAS
jgi:energy-coupling factor transport system ATP-binding protein